MLPLQRPNALTIPALLAIAILIAPPTIGCSRSVGEETGSDGGIAAPPGARPYPAALSRRIAAALAAKGTEYRPRTHHLRPDGSPVHTNRLILETSPYLIQHAHNPVDWFPWGEEAFERARELDRPILLSVGYSTCHWCHVMERESFEDPAIARFMNENFVAIKVDREERPDVDGVYMQAVRLLSGNAGWPMTVALTPDRRPFFGGTYFPARTGDRGSGIGFLELLQRLDGAYRQDRDAVAARAGAISSEVARSLAPPAPAGLPGPQAIAAGAAALARSYDPEHGGFGRGRKFPRPATLHLLLRFHRRTGDPHALAMVERTLERMAAGGIHDQIGGGFHRYTVENTWLVPHFEKMLYDNAQLAATYLEAHQVTGRADFAAVVRRTLDYVAREMTAAGGGFYSATDADSPAPTGHHEEGWFFTWTPAEIHEALGEKESPLILRHYGVTGQGNFEGRSILHVAAPIGRMAASMKDKEPRLRRRIEKARALLYEVRSRRPPPHTDTKIVTAWNGLMISAFAQAARAFGDDAYRDRAVRAASFLLEHVRIGDRLARSHADGRPGPPAVLDDYAFLEAGLLDLFEATFDPRWLEEAMALQRTLDARFRDADSGGYYMTADDAEALLAREKPHYDGAEPAGNSIALLNLLRLHELTGEERFRREAERGLSAFSAALEGGPHALPRMLATLDFFLDRPKQVVLVAGRSIAEAGPFLRVLGDGFLPNGVVVAAVEGSGVRRFDPLTPLFRDRTALDGRVTAYVCEGQVCDLPTADPDVFGRQIAKVHPYDGFTPAPLAPRRAAPAGRDRR